MSLLANGTEPIVEDEISRRFLYPGEVVIGPHSAYLTERRRLLADLGEYHESVKVRHWANTLLPDLDMFISRELAREEQEEDDGLL